MDRDKLQRRLVVNADDFGRSCSINQAVIHAHREGILTTASLMVNEPAFDEAVILAKENPGLGVGLHLTLVCGMSALNSDVIPGLVDLQKRFSNNAPMSGLRFFFQKKLHKQLEEEMAAQFEKFQATGLVLDHVNGHLNIHLHPVVLKILLKNATRWGIKKIRLTDDRLRLNLKLADGQWLYRISHAFIYRCLSTWARPLLQRQKIGFTSVVFGLLQNAHVDADYITKLLPQLPSGDSELYSHPSLDEFKHELDAFVDPKIKALVKSLGIQLIRYQDL